MSRECLEHKICNKCHQDLPIDSYRIIYSDSSRGRKFYFSNICRICANKAANIRVKANYHKSEANKALRQAYNKEYTAKNRAKITKRYMIWQKNRESTNIHFRLRRRMSAAIRRAMKSPKSRISMLQYLPYSIQELKDHLQSQFDQYMTWENYGKYWEIDHKFPISRLPHDSFEDENFQKAWNLNNLRPLSVIENRAKGNKIQ